MLETIKTIIKAIFWIIIVPSLIAGVLIWEQHDNEKMYNHGICYYCEQGRYHLVGVTGRNGAYIYECDNCYKTITTANKMN